MLELARVFQHHGRAALDFGNVLVGGDGAAVGHRFVQHGDDAAVLQALLDDAAAAQLVRVVAFGKGAFGFFGGVVAEAHRVLHQFAERDARLHHVGGEAVHFEIALVDDDQLLVPVEHAEALHHVGEGGVELQVAGMQLLGNAEHLHFALLELGDVGTGADHAAVIGALFGDQQPAAVRKLDFDGFVRVAVLLEAPLDVFLGRHAVEHEGAAHGGDAEDFLLRHARHDDVGGEGAVVHILAVIENDAVVRVIEREAVRHHVKGMHEARARLLGDHLILRVDVHVRRGRVDLAGRFDHGAVGQAAAADFDDAAAGRGVAEAVGCSRNQALDDARDLAGDFVRRHVEAAEGGGHELLQLNARFQVVAEVAAERAVQFVAGEQVEVGVKQRQADIGPSEKIGNLVAVLLLYGLKKTGIFVRSLVQGGNVLLHVSPP